MSRWATALKTQPENPKLDLLDYVGQRVATYRFDLVNIKTGYRRTVRPIADQIPTISHDISRTVTRQLSNLIFRVPDSNLVDVITTRIEPFMLIGGRSFSLGRFMYNSEVRTQLTDGDISSGTLYDEAFIVDQKMDASFSERAFVSIYSFDNQTTPRVQVTLQSLLRGLPVTLDIASTPFTSAGSWPAGTSRGFVVEQLALDGDYFSPWFTNNNRMRFIRSFDPATANATFDLDRGNRVIRERVLKTNDLIESPNVFVVVANGVGSQDAEIVGRYEVPSSAPHSVANRGFVIPLVENRQVEDSFQATAIAANIGQRQTIFERIELYTPPDPRHDGYDVLHWQGSNWLEMAWSLPCIEGASMQHVARRAYPT